VEDKIHRSRGAFFVRVGVMNKRIKQKLASEPDLRQMKPVVVNRLHHGRVLKP